MRIGPNIPKWSIALFWFNRGWSICK
jgi:hypothetical protein